ncbi:MAG: hypothetical protein RLZZ253_3389 [Verrucomicrobiota bacterium]
MNGGERIEGNSVFGIELERLIKRLSRFVYAAGALELNPFQHEFFEIRSCFGHSM